VWRVQILNHLQHTVPAVLFKEASMARRKNTRPARKVKEQRITDNTSAAWKCSSPRCGGTARQQNCHCFSELKIRFTAGEEVLKRLSVFHRNGSTLIVNLDLFFNESIVSGGGGGGGFARGSGMPPPPPLSTLITTVPATIQPEPSSKRKSSSRRRTSSSSSSRSSKRRKKEDSEQQQQQQPASLPSSVVEYLRRQEQLEGLSSPQTPMPQEVEPNLADHFPEAHLRLQQKVDAIHAAAAAAGGESAVAAVRGHLKDDTPSPKPADGGSDYDDASGGDAESINSGYATAGSDQQQIDEELAYREQEEQHLQADQQ
jgi:hypothetical protein